MNTLDPGAIVDGVMASGSAAGGFTGWMIAASFLFVLALAVMIGWFMLRFLKEASAARDHSDAQLTKVVEGNAAATREQTVALKEQNQLQTEVLLRAIEKIK